MSLGSVEVTQEVLLSCLTHALSTEAEEIMGLLLGDIQEDANGQTISRIMMCYPQIRTDRRADRVETSPEQMARCSAHAERLSKETGIRTRVVGWYHSHPHITVLPSHVDVRTQAMYQMLDPGFVGLIFSVFNNNSSETKEGRVQVTAFQSVPHDSPLADSATSSFAPSAPCSHTAPPSSSHPTSHSTPTKPTNTVWGTPSITNSPGLEGFSSADLAGLDALTKTAIRASAEAMHHHAPGTLVRREVPLSIVPPRTTLEFSGLQDCVVLQRILAMEEKAAYTNAMASVAALQSTPQPPASSSLPTTITTTITQPASPNNVDTNTTTSTYPTSSFAENRNNNKSNKTDNCLSRPQASPHFERGGESPLSAEKEAGPGSRGATSRRHVGVSGGIAEVVGGGSVLSSCSTMQLGGSTDLGGSTQGQEEGREGPGRRAEGGGGGGEGSIQKQSGAKQQEKVLQQQGQVTSSLQPGSQANSTLASLARLHYVGCYQQGLTLMLETLVAPALSGMRAMLQQQALLEKELRRENQLLKGRLEARQENHQSS